MVAFDYRRYQNSIVSFAGRPVEKDSSSVLSVKLGGEAKPRIAQPERLRAGTTWGALGREAE